MTNYDVVNAPRAASYAPPIVDFSAFGDWGPDYWKGRAAARQDDLATAFRGGLPVGPNGQPDYGAMARILGQKGDVQDAVTLSKLAQQQQLQQQGMTLSPLLTGGGAAAPAAAGTQAPAPQAAPGGASSVPVASPTPPSPASGGGGASSVPQGDQKGSVVDLVSARLPDDEPRTGTIINNIARSIGVDPNVALSPEQAAKVDRLVSGYEARTRQAQSAPGPQPQSAPAPQSGPAGGALVAPVPLPKGFTDPQAAIQALRLEAARLGNNPYAKGQVEMANSWADRIEAAQKPLHVGERILDPQSGRTLYEPPTKPQVVGGNLVRIQPNGQPEVVYQGDSGLIDDETISFMAEQARAGDNSVFTNVGRGAQGAQNLKKLRQEIQRQNKAAGTGGADQAMRNAEYQGTKAAQRARGTRETQIDLAATEFKQILPVVREASAKVTGLFGGDRSRYPDLNRIIQAWETKTGDPNIVAFGGGINSLINVYARAISPTGAPTVSDKDHAREILDKAWSQGQFDAAVGLMEKEIDAALASPAKVREEQRKRFLEGAGGAAAPAAPKPPEAVKPGVVRSKADYDKLPSGATFTDEAGATWRKP